MSQIKYYTDSKVEVEKIKNQLDAKGYRQIYNKTEKELKNFEYTIREHRGSEGAIDGEIKALITWVE